MHVEPVASQTFQARDAVTDLIIENLRAATRNGIKPGVANPHDGVTNSESAVFGNGNDLGSGETVQMHLGESLLDAAKQPFKPINFQLWMQAALHQHSSAAKLHSLADLLVNGIEVENVALSGELAFQRTVEGAERAVLGAEVRVIDVAIDDVSDHALRMQLLPNRIGLHTNADQIIGAEHL